MKKQVGIALAMLWMVVACGRSASDDRSPLDGDLTEKPIRNVPKQLALIGDWPPDAHFQTREMGSSRMVQLHAKLPVAESPNVARLNEMITLTKFADLEWVSPAPADCTLTQRSFDGSVKNGDFIVDIQLWGWDTAGKNRSCQAFLERAKTDGVIVTLKKVPVRLSAAVEQVTLTLKPSK